MTCTCYEAGRDPLCPVHGQTAGDISSAARPSLLTAFPDSEWAYYIAGHDEAELGVVDEPADLEWEKLWMREIDGSQADDHGLLVDDEEMLDGPCWIECPATANGAEPWMGVKYAPAD